MQVYYIGNGKIKRYPLKQYGTSIIIDKGSVIALYTILALLIPVIVPVFVSPFLAWLLPNNWRMRI